MQYVIGEPHPYRCRDCLILKTRIFCGHKKYKNRNKRYAFYKDELGKPWNKTQCNECSKKWAIKNSRAKGRHSNRSECTDHKNKLGLKSEYLVKKFFEKEGFSVEQSSAHGPDLILKRDGIVISCEVKTACKASNAESWFTSPIYPLRCKDDLIAIVFDDAGFIIENMCDHLKKCTVSGTRRVTALGKFFYS